MTLSPWQIRSLVERALKEDIGRGDITTSLIFPEAIHAQGMISAGEEIILAGIMVAREVFFALDRDLIWYEEARDGERIKEGGLLVRVSADGRALLNGERVALNFLQHLSGIATLTARFVEEVRGCPARIVDTRKTTPGLRLLEKYAVNVGGGGNHRFDLSGVILIKDNHITLAGGVREAIQRVRQTAPHTAKIEVEARDLQEVEEALEGGAEIIMLDNMDVAAMREAVKHVNGQVLLEASGGVTLSKVREIAETGVDIISVGALTHSAPAVDMSMEIRGIG